MPPGPNREPPQSTPHLPNISLVSGAAGVSRYLLSPDTPYLHQLNLISDFPLSVSFTELGPLAGSFEQGQLPWTEYRVEVVTSGIRLLLPYQCERVL